MIGGRSPGLGRAFWIRWLPLNMAWAAIIGLLVEFSQGVARAPAAILVAGTLQWLVLRRAIRVSMWWIPATVVGSIAGVALAIVVVIAVLIIFRGCLFDCPPNPTTPEVSATFYALATLIPRLATPGAVLGLAQWPVLRPGTDNRAGPWMLASVFSFIVGGLAAYASDFVLQYPRYLAIVPPGVIYSAATGVVLTRMVFHAESRT